MDIVRLGVIMKITYYHIILKPFEGYFRKKNIEEVMQRFLDPPTSPTNDFLINQLLDAHRQCISL